MSQYRLELISDRRLLANSVLKYQLEDLADPDRALDSTLFGANATKQKRCHICNNSLEKCPSHYAVIELPIPIVRSLCYKHTRKLLPCLCPMCSHLLLEEEVLNEVKQLNRSERFKVVVELIKKFKEKKQGSATMIVCPYCHHQMTSTIEINEKYKHKASTIFIIKDPVKGTFETMNPIYAQEVLQRFTQIEEIGFSKCFHPKNFMTSYIPIIPAKLRAKSVVEGQETASALTTYYRQIIETVIPILMNVKSVCVNKNTILIDKTKEDEFYKGYDLLNAYYRLIVDVGSENSTEELKSILNKGYRLGFDPSNCLIRKFKGKNRSIFNKGMLGLVHDVSSRVVLGAAEDAKMSELVVPVSMANRMMLLYPVYKENIKFMKMLIIAMTDSKIQSNQFIPRVIGVQSIKTKKFQRLTQANAQALAVKLEPGDEVGISLFNNDFVIQNRHPSLREEAMTSFQVSKDLTSTVGLPLAVCAIKQADFDGDEIQCYLVSGHHIDVESLLLNSVFAQLRSPGEGGLSFYYSGSHDDTLGVKRISNIPINYRNHERVNPRSALAYIEDELPSDLNYHSEKLVIENGKVEPSKCSFNNVEFYKFYASMYGEKMCCRLIDKCTQVGYDINRVYGASLGFEIRFWGSDEQKKRIQELKKQAYDKAVETMKRDGKSTIETMMCFSAVESEIKEMLMKSAEGQNIEKNNYSTAQPKPYYTMVINPNHVAIDGQPVPAMLAEGTRINFGGYRFSTDPRDAGYVDRGYCEDIRPYDKFAIMMEELKSIYTRTSSVAKQGYMTNKMTVLFERAFVDNNGCLVDGKTLLANQYGSAGFDPRCEVMLNMPDLELDDKTFNQKYKDKRLQQLHKEIIDLRAHYKRISAFVKQPIKSTFVTGLDFNQLFINKGETSIKEIDRFIGRLLELFVPVALQNNELKLLENFKNHEYYFRVMLSQYKLDSKLEQTILDRIAFSLVNAGDPVGVKTALAASAPLTQEALDAIHAASSGGAAVDKVKRANGLDSFLQLLAGAKCNDTAIITIALKDDSEEACKSFTLNHETFYFKDIWALNEIRASIKIPKQLTTLYGEEIAKEKRHPYYVKSVWNMVRLSGYGVKVSDIMNAIMSSYTEIKFILPFYLNKTQITANIYFKEDTQIQRIHQIVHEWTLENEANIVHGRYLRNCFITENVNDKGHYVIEANESVVGNQALQHLILDPLVDSARCRTSNPRDSLELFGIFEEEARHYEQLMFTATTLGSTKAVTGRTYSTISAVQTSAGELTFCDALSMSKTSDGELMKKLKFERADVFIKEALIRGDKETVNEFTSANVFAQLPRLGSSVSEYMLYPIKSKV